MSIEELIIYVVLGALLSVCLCVVIFYFINLSLNKYVMNNSTFLKGFNTNIVKIERYSKLVPFSYGVRLESKKKFDKFIANVYIADVCLFKNEMLFCIEVEKFKNNSMDTLSNYPKFTLLEFNLLKKRKCSFNNFLKREQAIVKKILEKNNIQIPKFRLNAFYISPQGRNRYCNTFTYTYKMLFELYEKKEDEDRLKEEYKKSKQYQRAKMTLSLRNDVLMRDKSTCQMCGATVASGAVLEIDHIIPVSKGGESIMSNLQTLCFDCNRGKKDKL